MRAPLVPASVKKLVKLGLEVLRSVHGRSGWFCRCSYVEAGARIETDRAALGAADLVLRIRKPNDEDGLAEIGRVRELVDPFNERGLIDALAAKGVTAISMRWCPAPPGRKKWTC